MPYLLISLAFCLNSALAQTTPAPTAYTLPQIVERTLSQSDLLRAQLKELESETLQYQGAGLLPNPTAITQFGNLETGGSNGFLVEVGVLQSLPFPGKLSALKKMAEIKKRLTETQENELRLKLEHEVSLLAVRLAVQKTIAAHSIERRRRFNLIREYLRTHPQRSPMQRAESAMVENQIRILEKGILELERDRKVTEVALQFFLRTQEPVEVKVDWISQPQLPRMSELEPELHLKNPELGRKHLEVGISESRLLKSKLDPWPDFNVGFSYRRENAIPSNTFLTAFLTFPIPLFDHGQYSVAAQQAQLDSNHLRREYLKEDLTRQFKELYAKVETSAKVLSSLPPKLVHPLEKDFNDAENEFRKNRVNTAILIQLDAQIHETLDSIFESQINYFEDLSHLYLLLGRHLEWK